ncbi:unnamed protein product [Phaedon cochleariae]|uniref:Protein Wnt n=1 Tax=Phaedon cochleariae TaxID=80249 RepID=A0A9N9SG43_PHACE|nr:unnamed protein product [Phaedon cochleariae]
MVFLVLVVNVISASPLMKNPLRSYRSRSILPIPVGTSPSVVDSIAAGTQLAIEHCQHAFQWDRWNCPKSTFTRQHKLLPTRETAYAKAIVAAGIVYEITRNCSRGSIEGCGCDQSLGGPPTHLPNHIYIENSTELLSSLVQEVPNLQNTSKWSWGGCSDDPSYAIEIAQRFLNALDKDMKPAAYVARHNSKIGSETASFGEISRKLKERYRQSERLSYETVEKSMYVENTAKHEMMEKEVEGMESSLVYLEQSPDYCVLNTAEGISGTKGRMCSRNTNSTMAAERNSCRNLCKKCGYTVKRLKKTVSKRCNCTFEWCCEVKCDTCQENVDEFFCV